MADFAKWATACESAYHETGSFKAAYQRNLVEATESAARGRLGRGGRARLSSLGGARPKMLEELNSITGQAHVNAKDWPKEPNALSARLRRLAPLLRSKGINAEKLQRTGAKRGWSLAPISAWKKVKRIYRHHRHRPRPPMRMERDDNCTTEENVTRNPTTINKSDGCDVSDDKFTGVSGPQRATSVPSDIDAAYEELRVRGDAAAQSHQPLRQPRQRIRIRARRRTSRISWRVYLYMTNHQTLPDGTSPQRSRPLRKRIRLKASVVENRASGDFSFVVATRC